MNPRLPNLTSPITIRGKVFKNRITASPVSAAGVGEDGFVPYFIIDPYREKAEGGCASVSVGEVAVNNTHADRLGDFPPNDFVNFEGPQMAGWKKYSDAIREGGALAFIELCHGGAVRDSDDGEDPVAYGPNDEIRPDGKRVAMIDEAKMAEIANEFGQAALYMKKAGFDGVIVHGGHAWLPHQFLSTTYNHRTDAYGGSAENRARFPIMIMRRMREYVGEDFLLELRVSCSEVTKDGIDKDVLLALAKGIEGHVDILHFSAGLYDDPVPSRMTSHMYDDHFCNMPVAEYIKKNTEKLYINVVGGINSPEDADRYIGEGRIDFIALGRQVTSCDVNFANKCMNGEEDDINRCLRCMLCNGGPPDDVDDVEGAEASTNKGFGSPMKKGGPPRREGPPQMPTVPRKRMNNDPVCTVNPMKNTDYTEQNIPKAEKTVKLLVIGGGPAGMHAAITAHDRGHEVTLVEKKESLGGQMLFADSDSHKADLVNYRDVLIRRVEKRGIRVMLGVECTPELIADLAPEYIICAVGATPAVPELPGVEKASRAMDYYYEDMQLGERVVIIGGGLIGCETAVDIGEKGVAVTILESRRRIASYSNPTLRNVLRSKLRKEGVVIKAGHSALRISDEGVWAQRPDGGEELFPADKVLYAAGMSPNKATVETLRAAAGDIPFVAVGDCDVPKRVGHAGVAGCQAALAI